MIAEVLFPAVIGALFIIFSIMAFKGDEWGNSPFIGSVFMILGCFFVWVAYDNNIPEVQAKIAYEAQRKAQQEQSDAIPRVIRQADGCKVYAFKAQDRWHYFTRCPDSRTVTDTAYEVCTGYGKYRRCHEEHSSIEVTK